ncbi:bifunctional UDP-N-acetylglucosamine diphosphorylase/glucosamine-1-phosphate N-acetyltransferase GlmU [soil metagenome]
MKSALPKVMHTLCGRPIVHYPVRAALDAGCTEVVVVVGHGREHVTAYLAKAFGDRVKTAVQETQNGTGDAARSGLSAVSADAERILLFYGDVPLLEASDVASVLARDAAFALATCVVADATGYGRILRDAEGRVVEIREHKDLRTDEERGVREINPGIFASSRAFFSEALAGLKPINAQGELYLTDFVIAARARGIVIDTVDSRGEVLVGINDRAQLADAETVLQRRIIDTWRREGVTIRDGAQIEDSVVIEPDAMIQGHAVLRGATTIGAGAIIDVGAVITDASIGAGTHVKPYSVIDRSKVGQRAMIGPFSHLRPESELADDVHVGNFVETKKTRMGKGSKANHLAYLGDGDLGERVNVGAGTIFCNYDGFLKHTTTIEDDAFIGSDSQLVAPVRIGKGAYVGTGTTVTRDVPADALAISRVKQENKEGYASKLRARMKAAKAAKDAKK